MSLVASPATSGKVAPLRPSPRLSDLLMRVGAAERPAAARHVLRAAYRKLVGVAPPSLPAEDLRGLAAALLAALPTAPLDTIGDALVASWEALTKASPAIQVDNLLRATLAADMPSAERLVLRTLAGHADENGRCYPSIPTLADECGMSEGTARKAVHALADRGWLTIGKGAPRADGGATSNIYDLTPRSGRWWTVAERAAGHRGKLNPKARTPVSPGETGVVSPGGTRPLSPGETSPVPRGDTGPVSRGGTQSSQGSAHPERPSGAPMGSERPPSPPPGGDSLSVERGEEEKPPESTERPKPKETLWRWEIPARHLEAIASMGADVDKVVAHVFPDGMPMVTSQSAPIVSQSWQLAAIAVAEDPRFRLDVGPLANAAE